MNNAAWIGFGMVVLVPCLRLVIDMWICPTSPRR
jgi:hypothetical protein